MSEACQPTFEYFFDARNPSCGTGTMTGRVRASSFVPSYATAPPLYDPWPSTTVYDDTLRRHIGAHQVSINTDFDTGKLVDGP